MVRYIDNNHVIAQHSRSSAAFVMPPPNAVVFIIRQNQFPNQAAITKLPDVQSGNCIAA